MVHLKRCLPWVNTCFYLEKWLQVKERKICQGIITLVQTIMMCHNVASLSNLLGKPELVFLLAFMQSAAKT